MERHHSYTLLALLAFVGLILPTVGSAETEPSTWGRIKSQFQAAPGEAQSPPPPSGGLGTLVYSTRPAWVNEHWRDPNNPGSGEHVVMFFIVSDSRNPWSATRLWRGYRRDWLDRWMLWQRPYGAGLQAIMLFADGSWWWWHRIWNTAPGLAAQFELVW